MISVQALLDASPLIAMIAIGVLLRVGGIVNDDSRLVLTRVAYYVTIPTAITTSIASAELTSSMLLLPVIGFVVPIILDGIIYVTTRHLANQPQLRGTMLVCMVGLVVFGYAYADLFYGTQAMARLALYDAGNVTYISTMALWLAQHYGTRQHERTSPVLAMFKSPFVWAALVGLALSLLKIPLGGPVGNLLSRLAAANTPLVMIALGTFLRPKAVKPGPLFHVVLVRMLVGGVLGWGLAYVLGVRGLDMVMVGTAASLPVGTTPLIYAGNEGLDAEFAAAVISTSVVLGAVLINIVPHILAALYL